MLHPLQMKTNTNKAFSCIQYQAYVMLTIITIIVVVATKARYKCKDKFGSAPRFLCLFYSIVFYQPRHAGRYVVTRDVLAPWCHDVARRKAYPTYSGPQKVYKICCTKFSLDNFYKLDNNYFKTSKHKISRLQSVNL